MRTDRRPAAFAALLAGLIAAGCGKREAPLLPPPVIVPPEILSTEPVAGFDEAGEPTLQRCADGSLRVRFAQMPPSHAPGEAGLIAYQDMDRAMTAAIGTPAEWLPPDVLVIAAPAEDTAERVAAFLKTYRPAG